MHVFQPPFLSPFYLTAYCRRARVGLATVRTRFVSRSLVCTKESKSGKSFWDTDFFFEKKCQTWTALPDTESPSKYFKMGEFRKPWLGAKGHVFVITKVASARELGYDWGRSAMSTPSRPIRRSASTNRDIHFWKHYVFLSRLLA